MYRYMYIPVLQAVHMHGHLDVGKYKQFVNEKFVQDATDYTIKKYVLNRMHMCMLLVFEVYLTNPTCP